MRVNNTYSRETCKSVIQNRQIYHSLTDRCFSILTRLRKVTLHGGSLYIVDVQLCNKERVKTLLNFMVFLEGSKWSNIFIYIFKNEYLQLNFVVPSPLRASVPLIPLRLNSVELLFASPEGALQKEVVSEGYGSHVCISK